MKRGSPFDLPPRLAHNRRDLDLATPLNVVTTADIIGGNSGSLVLNRDGELGGLVFDGNIQAFAWDYVFTEVAGRSVAIHSAAMLEVLRKLYGMSALAEELDEARTK